MAILGVVILVLLGVFIGLVNSEDDSGEMMEAEEVSEMVSRVEEGVDFRNGEFVEKFIGEAKGSEAVETIEAAIFEDLGGTGSYTAFAAGSDVAKGVSFPFDTLEFSLQVSPRSGANGASSSDVASEGDKMDGAGAGSEARNFYVQIALLKDAYYGILIGADEGSEAELLVKYIRPAEEAGYTEEEAIGKLKAWAESAEE